MALTEGAGAAAAGGVGVAGFSELWLINSTSKTSMDFAGMAPGAERRKRVARG